MVLDGSPADVDALARNRPVLVLHVERGSEVAQAAAVRAQILVHRSADAADGRSVTKTYVLRAIVERRPGSVAHYVTHVRHACPLTSRLRKFTSRVCRALTSKEEMRAECEDTFGNQCALPYSLAKRWVGAGLSPNPKGQGLRIP